MNPRRGHARQRVLGLGLVVANALACGEPAEVPDATREAAIAACEQNTAGMQSVARRALNAARNPLADRVASMDWHRFCACFGPEHAEMERAGDELSYDEYEKRRDAIAVKCTEIGAPLTTSAEAPSASHSGENRIENDSQFRHVIDHCVRSPDGYLTNVRIHLEVEKSPRASRVMEMDPSAYCSCYVSQMRRELGDDVAHRYLSAVRIPNDLDVIATSRASDGAYEACAAQLIPFDAP